MPTKFEALPARARASSRKAAVCIASGGLDSICTAAYLREVEGYNVYMLTFAYGQRDYN